MEETVINVKELKKYLVEFSDARLEEEAQKDLMKSIVETASEKLDIDKAKFKEYATLYFLRVYKPEAFAKQEAKVESLEVIKSL